MKTKIFSTGVLTCLAICLAFPIKAGFSGVAISGMVSSSTLGQPLERVFIEEVGYENEHFTTTDERGFFSLKVSGLPATLDLQKRDEDGRGEKRAYRVEHTESVIDWDALPTQEKR